MTSHSSTSTLSAAGGSARLVRRLGAAGFLFFAIKGLLWVVVPIALWAFGG